MRALSFQLFGAADYRPCSSNVYYVHTVRANRKVRFQSEIVNRCGEPSCRASLTIKKMTKSHLDRKSQQKNDLLSGTMDRLLNRVSVRRAQSDARLKKTHRTTELTTNHGE